jgi:hypothetical protein
MCSDYTTLERAEVFSTAEEMLKATCALSDLFFKYCIKCFTVVQSYATNLIHRATKGVNVSLRRCQRLQFPLRHNVYFGYNLRNVHNLVTVPSLSRLQCNFTRARSRID